MISAKTKSATRITEWDVKQFINDRYKKDQLFLDHGPDVAVNARAPFHMETGKGTTSKVMHFQLRPDPLAK